MLSILAASALIGPGVAAAETPGAPEVLSSPATAVGRTSATFNALVNPNGANVEECEFEYGTSPSSLSLSVPCTALPGSGEEFVLVSAPVGGLTENTKYYFRIVATNEFGTSESPTRSFTTLPTVPRANIEPATLITKKEAELHGDVNPDAATVEECRFEVSTSSGFVGASSVACEVLPGGGEAFVPVHAHATGLVEHTKYYARLVAKNAFGTDITGATSFTTPPTKPGAITEPAKEVKRNSATLAAIVNPHGANVTTCEFEYGISPALGSHATCATSPGSGEDGEPVTAGVSGLSESTTYYFRIVAGNEFGTTFGGTKRFRTLPTAPKVFTNEATKLSANSAQLNAKVNPAGSNVTSCEFEWGTSIAYGSHASCSSLPGSGESPVAVSAQLSGLSGKTTYHFRIVATNSFGTSFGNDVKFVTEVGGTKPVIKGLKPRKGPASGGTKVTISGSGFTEAKVVKFGSVEAKFTVNSGTSISAESPKESPGLVAVSVETPVGKSEETPADLFKYKP